MMDRTGRLVDAFLTRADVVLGATYSAVLYGSAVRGDQVEGRSDCNLLVVAERLAPAQIRELAPAVAGFERDRISPPLLFTHQEWVRSADVFPIELTDMRAAYRVLRGADPLHGLVVRPADLRHALEGELRGKLLRLRTDYALYADREDLLAAVVGASVGSLRVLLRGVASLAGHDIPADDAGLAALAAGICRVPAAPLLELLPHRRDAAWRCRADLFLAYLAVVEAAIHFVDTVHSGEP